MNMASECNLIGKRNQHKMYPATYNTPLDNYVLYSHALHKVVSFYSGFKYFFYPVSILCVANKKFNANMFPKTANFPGECCPSKFVP